MQNIFCMLNHKPGAAYRSSPFTISWKATSIAGISGLRNGAGFQRATITVGEYLKFSAMLKSLICKGDSGESQNFVQNSGTSFIVRQQNIWGFPNIGAVLF
jgi:hypothetical protein